MLIAIGDAATELMYWQMGSPKANHDQMAALADRYESATGSGLIYNVGGLAGVAANIAGFGSTSQPLLVGSYVVTLAACARIAMVVLGAQPASRRPTQSIAQKVSL